MMLSNQVAKGVVKTAALIVKNYKLILGVQLYGFWQVSCSSQTNFPSLVKFTAIYAATDHSRGPIPFHSTIDSSVCGV